MTASDPRAKEDFHRYLTTVNEAVLWKLDGLSEYDARRPLTPTATNVLGVIKHLACIQIGYFGWTFGRNLDIQFPWYSDDAEPNADMFATENETREEVIALFRQAMAIGDATVAELELNAPGRVLWWTGERANVTLSQILLHVVCETNRHAGQIDIVRELIDGQAGLRAENSNFPDNPDWPPYYARVQGVADRFR